MARSLRAFPRDLAKAVVERWHQMVAGDYVTPPIPNDALLRELLETAYLSAGFPEEGRYPKFNIVAVPLSDPVENRVLGDVWCFNEPRPLSVNEIRRLAPAVDSKKSAILAKWDLGRWYITGLVDLGTSWGRARIGLQYHYHFPNCLFIQLDRVGRIRVYQGQYQVVALVDGRLERRQVLEFPLALHRPVHNGLHKIWKEITYPTIEEPREYEDFQFVAFWNTLAALANCISDEGHGGALVIAPAGRLVPPKSLRIKYPQTSSTLRDAFIAFMNVRHRVADYVVRTEQG